eukprot:55883_1
MCCNSCKAIDLEDTEGAIQYNRELAFKLTLSFIISGCSCLIIMTWFAVSGCMSSFGQVDGKVFQFLAASCGTDCVVYFGQIVVFKKRDRMYFLEDLLKEFPDQTSWTSRAISSHQKGDQMNFMIVTEMLFTWRKPRENWLRFLKICLVLAVWWIGCLTSVPSDMNISMDVSHTGSSFDP